MKNSLHNKLLKLIATGVRSGQDLNTGMRDIVTGRALFRHASKSDDAARQFEKSRTEDRSSRNEEREALDRLINVLERIDRKIKRRNDEK